MHILHINCNYIGTALHQLMIEHLDKLGYTNQVFVPTYDKNLSVIKTNNNVCVCECFNKCDRVLFDYKQLKIRNALEKNVDVSKYDLIHAYTLFTDGNCARVLSKKHKIPYVVAVRNTDVNDFFRLMPHLRNRGIKIMREASAVFFLSEAYRRQVFDKYVPAKYYDELMDKTHIIPNGIDDFWLKNSCECKGDRLNSSSPIKLVYAGRIDKNKNITTTQKAIKLLRSNGYPVTLTVVGKIQDKKEYELIIKDENTSYLPAMPKEKLINLYRKCDIFVMPSFTESFGLVYAEAMSQGLPVIYSFGQGFDGQFAEGIVGYHVLARNFLSVADGIKNVINNYAMIRNNVAECAKRFNWSTVVKSYDDIYHIIIDS